jgi:FTR1 family protein
VLSALLVALREGVEAALVVGIVLVYLGRTGRQHLSRWVWSGLTAAVAASLGGAALLDLWKVSEDGLEGLLMLVAAALVVTMIWWMNRVARRLRKEIEERVESLSQRTTLAAGLGIAGFVFLMVVREGIEMVLILRAVELSSEGISIWIGTSLGLALAVAVGIFFFKGTLRIPLGRFFAATSTILSIVAAQLCLTGIHEMSEAQWLPSSRREMALVGPIVRHEIFFFVLIFGVAVMLILREWFSASAAKGAAAAAAESENPAERRRREYERRRQRRWMLLAAGSCLIVVLALTADFVYAQVAAAPPPAQTVAAQNGVVQIPVSSVDDGRLHFFLLDSEGTQIRFIVIRKPSGGVATALDACAICGPIGYRQEGQNVVCRNCGAPIYIPTIGQGGGCNPIAFASRIEAGQIVFQAKAIAEAARPLTSH